MFAALKQAANVIGTAGIIVKNESSVPILVICSQLTPLYWAKVMPGDTWNQDNWVKMGKVWFTLSISMYDARNEPTVAGTAVNLLAITATAVLPVALPIFIGAAVVSGITASRGVSKTGVYSDGTTHYVRGNAIENAYVLHFATEEERLGKPYTGPPPPEVVAATNAALQGVAPAASSASASGEATNVV